MSSRLIEFLFESSLESPRSDMSMCGGWVVGKGESLFRTNLGLPLLLNRLHPQHGRHPSHVDAESRRHGLDGLAFLHDRLPYELPSFLRHHSLALELGVGRERPVLLFRGHALGYRLDIFGRSGRVAMHGAGAPDPLPE